MVRKLLVLLLVLSLITFSGCAPEDGKSNNTTPSDIGDTDTDNGESKNDGVTTNPDGSVTLPKVDF